MSINATVDGTTYNGVQTISVGGKSIALAESGGGSGGIDPVSSGWQNVTDSVKNFLTQVSYNPSDYSTSQIGNYAPSTADRTNAKPVGKTLSLSAGTLDRNGFKQTVSAGNVTLHNDIPNVWTPYTVAGSDGSIKNVGTLKPNFFLRQINAGQAINVRDLGGWSCDGGTVKYGMLYRGGIFDATDRDILVNQCGIRAEIDLRSTSDNGGRTSSLLGDDVFYHVYGSYAWYTLSNKSLWRQMLTDVFDCVKHNLPVYFHCAAGADRTGTLACVLEALLGMSQSDIDKDYELTSFYSGTDTDTNARRRNESEWRGLISEINAISGSTFRDKVVNFCAELGFSAAEINAFRTSMIDGTPEPVVPTVETYTVTKSLTNATLDNDAATVTQYQPFVANILPNDGYTLDGGTVTVSMGGVDITSTAYSDGQISIASVTGNISINVVAVVAPLVNLIDSIGIIADTGLSTSTGTNKSKSGFATIGSQMSSANLIRIRATDTIRIRGFNWPSANDGQSAIVFYDSTASKLTAGYIYTSKADYNAITATWSNGDLTLTASAETYIRLSAPCADTSAVFVTRNQALPTA